MFRAGQMEIDLIDTGDDTLLQLDIGRRVDANRYGLFKFTNPEPTSIRRSSARPQVGNFVYAMVMGYHTAAYPKGKEPKSWAEFWDIKAFPGPRTLADMASGAPDLEFALIADGVPPDKLYPLDIERGFKSLSRVRPAVHEVLGHRRACRPRCWPTKKLCSRPSGARGSRVAIDKGALARRAVESECRCWCQAYGIPNGRATRRRAGSS